MTDLVTKDQRHSFDDQALRRVSFVLHTLNRATYIGKALDMAGRLVGPDDELIVVDGASTDGTTEIIARYGDLVDIFVSEPDDHSTHAENKGILLAHGKYIKPINDDDEYFPDAMEQVIEVMEAHPEVDILQCGGMRQVGDRVVPVYVPPGVDYGKSAEDVLRYGCCGCGIFIRRSALAKTGLFNYSGVATDGEFLAQAICNGATVKFCRINLFHHTLHEGSYFVRRRDEYPRDVERMAKEYCSVGFYWRYRLRRMVARVIKRYALLRWPVLGTRQMLRGALAALRRGRHTGRPDQESPIWDGGFS